LKNITKVCFGGEFIMFFNNVFLWLEYFRCARFKTVKINLCKVARIMWNGMILIVGLKEIDFAETAQTSKQLNITNIRNMKFMNKKSDTYLYRF
jgi:hypothetical protein